MPFCTTCGAAYAEWDRFCTKCGKDFDSPVYTRGSTLYFSCDGQGSELLVIYLKTIVFSILTLGIYSFWGRAAIRRYLYNSVRVGEDRFQYHGTGPELLRGWLKAVAVVVAMYLVFFGISVAFPRTGPTIAMLFLWGVLLLLVPFIHVGMLRYRMSRTSLRGIHFQSRAQVWELAKVYYKGLFLTVITLGFYSPWFVNSLSRYVAETTYYGDQPFGFDGVGGDLIKSYVLMIVLLIPTLYLSAVWYFVKQKNYITSHTTFGPARLNLRMEFGSVVVLMITNWLLTVFTLGIGLPWAQLRWISYECQSLTLENFPGFAGIQQRAAVASATGEGMAALLDVDSDLGGGLAM